LTDTFRKNVPENQLARVFGTDQGFKADGGEGKRLLTVTLGSVICTGLINDKISNCNMELQMFILYMKMVFLRSEKASFVC